MSAPGNLNQPFRVRLLGSEFSVVSVDLSVSSLFNVNGSLRPLGSLRR
jgi:hypothetical protein